MARPRGLNINLTDLLAARLLADADEMTPPELAKALKLRDGYGLIERLLCAGWVCRSRLDYGPSHFRLSNYGKHVLDTTLVLIGKAAERRA